MGINGINLNTINPLSFKSNTATKEIKTQNTTSEAILPKPETSMFDIPASAWQANTMMPVTNLFANIEREFAQVQKEMAQMSTAIHQQIKDVTAPLKQEAAKEAKLEAMKGEALLNIQGPVTIQSPGIPANKLQQLNKKLENVDSLSDLEKVLKSRTVPKDTPLVISQPSEEGSPKLTIEASRKELVLDLIDYMQKGNEYNCQKIITSEAIDFKNGDSLVLTVN